MNPTRTICFSSAYAGGLLCSLPAWCYVLITRRHTAGNGGSEMSYAAGESRGYSYFDVIFQEGDQADEMFLITYGKVKISKKMFGVMVTLAELEEGDFFGEMALLDDAPRSATAVAAGPVEVVVFDRTALRECISQDPDFALKMLRETSQRLRGVDHELTQLVAKGRLQQDEAESVCKHLAG